MRLTVEGTETEDLFETLANKSPVGVCIIQDGKFCYTNPTFQNNTGYKEDELMGKDSLDLIVPEDRETARENAIKMLKGELTSPHQFRVIHNDNSIHWVVESVTSIQYHGRQAILANLVDITAHKQLEVALQAERNKLQSLIDALEYTITIQDTEYNIIYQNEPSRVASGGDHLGEKCYQAYEGRERVCDKCPVEEAFKDGKTHTAERRTKISGKVVFWENTAIPIRDAEGKVVSCMELARDVTERKEQEQALADELTQRRLLIDKSLDGIVVLDEDAKVVEANQRFADMLGYTLEEVSELHTWDLDKNLPPEKLLEMGRNVDEKGLHLETTQTRKDGSVIDVEISISGIMYGGRKLIFCIQRDVTERKRAREEREALLQEITKSNRRLEGANKELQDFVYVASHDLREPLRKISSFGTLLQDSLEGKLDEDQQENFEFMIDGARRMQDMIDDLLTYSRLTTRAKPPQQVFLNEVIENLKKLELATLLDETLGTIHIPEPLPPVQADLPQMNQLFQNLIGNGLKFHQEGVPPEIIIRAHGVDNKMIQIEVEDNGIGIDEKYHEQLFVMFKRLHSQAQYDGSGIGLAICKKIVERHGGDIGVKSTPGKGSIFWFTLPRGSYLKN